MPRQTIPLDQIRVASPCRASWDGMHGNDRVRHCAQCDKNVYNLSGMTRVDAEDLVSRTEGDLCVRFYRRSDGTMLTEDCPIGVAGWRRQALLIGGLAAAFFFGSISLLTAGVFVLPHLRDRGGEVPNPIQIVHDLFFPPPPVIMGGLCPIPPPIPAPVPPDLVPNAPDQGEQRP